MAWVATENFGTVDRILGQPDPAATLRIKMLGRDQARLLMRYEASEMNRYFFEMWEIVQIVVAGFFFFFLLFGTNEGKIPLALALVLLAIVLAQRFLLTPEIVAIGRLIDFTSDPGGYRAKFQVLHSAYVGLEMGKWGLQVLLAALLVTHRPRQSPNMVQPYPVVQKSTQAW